MLTVLDSKFDAHLAQPENITTLFIALHDENFYVREAALATIGRLSDLNPAFVMPSLRKVLIQILTELEYSGIGRNKEQSAKLLCHLISQAPNLVKPYKEAILKVDVTLSLWQYVVVCNLAICHTHIHNCFRSSFPN